MDPELLKQKLFKSIEKFFKRNTLRNIPEHEAILCCDDEMRNKLIMAGDRIIRIPAYRSIEHQDLYLTLIFTFYAMLGEQIDDIYDTMFLKRNAKNPALVEQLFIDLTTKDMLEADGTNLSSFVRKMLLGLHGGKRRRKRKSKSKKRKTTCKKQTKRCKKLTKRK
jgi:hypothetical protein